MTTSEKINTLGTPTFGWMAGLAITGALLLGVLRYLGLGWAGAALVGWLTSAALGFLGWWTTLKGLRGDNLQFFKFVFGGMTVRFFLCGALTAFFLGTGLVQPAGFVWGLIVGLLIFLGLEIGAVCAAAQTEGETESG